MFYYLSPRSGENFDLFMPKNGSECRKKHVLVIFHEKIGEKNLCATHKYLSFGNIILYTQLISRSLVHKNTYVIQLSHIMVFKTRKHIDICILYIYV